MAATLVDEKCVFCKIVAGQIPCHKVYEDEQILAFLDIGPIVRGHTLVVPKNHYANVIDTPAEVLAEINARMGKLVRAILAATETQACHVLTNCGVEASQSVHHLHYHILPRYTGDGYRLVWPMGTLDAGEADKLKAGIASALAGKR